MKHHGGGEKKFVIRPYEIRDREALRRIFAETAFHGRSYRHFFDDAEWLSDFMTNGYLDLEPESSFIAETEEGLVGYLTGTLDTNRYRRRWLLRVLPGIIVDFFAQGLWRRRRTWSFFWNGVRSLMKGEETVPAGLYRNYPAHFHINIKDKFRSGGAGRKLAEAFFGLVKRRNIKGIHVRTARLDGHHPFFEGLGFRPLRVSPLSLWNYLKQPPYFLVTYVISLTEHSR